MSSIPVSAFSRQAHLVYHCYGDVTTPGSDKVTVSTFKTALPHDEDKRGDFLWENFAGKPEEKKFENYGLENWKTNFEAFAASLVQKATSQKYDSASLRKALDIVLKDANDLAYLPVGAYQGTLDGGPVWIIVVKWESANWENSTLVHTRIFAFDLKTLKRVGYATCL